MKKKMESLSEMEPLREASETDVSDDEQSNDKEPRIKDVLENLSQSLSRKRASDLLHSMAASKGIRWVGGIHITPSQRWGNQTQSA